MSDAIDFADALVLEEERQKAPSQILARFERLLAAKRTLVANEIKTTFSLGDSVLLDDEIKVLNAVLKRAIQNEISSLKGLPR